MISPMSYKYPARTRHRVHESYLMLRATESLARARHLYLRSLTRGAVCDTATVGWCEEQFATGAGAHLVGLGVDGRSQGSLAGG